MNNKKCANCVYYDRMDKETLNLLGIVYTELVEIGMCKYRSPKGISQSFNTETEFLLGTWPVINSDQWCGKFKENREVF